MTTRSMAWMYEHVHVQVAPPSSCRWMTLARCSARCTVDRGHKAVYRETVPSRNEARIFSGGATEMRPSAPQAGQK